MFWLTWNRVIFPDFPEAWGYMSRSYISHLVCPKPLIWVTKVPGKIRPTISANIQAFSNAPASLSWHRHILSFSEWQRKLWFKVMKGIVQPKLQKRWPQFCWSLRRSLSTTNFVGFSGISVVIKCWDSPWMKRTCNVSKILHGISWNFEPVFEPVSCWVDEHDQNDMNTVIVTGWIEGKCVFLLQCIKIWTSRCTLNRLAKLLCQLYLALSQHALTIRKTALRRCVWRAPCS